MKSEEISEDRQNLEDMAKNNAIISHYSGSLAYGTNTPESDVDIRGVFVADEKYRTPFYSIEDVKISDEEDTVYYEIQKFINYCSRCNPTYLETLFVPEDQIIERTPAYDYIRKNRDLFLSKAVAKAYLEFADGQLKRINGHDKWISKPQPKERPQMVDYTKLLKNYTPDKIFTKDFDLRDYKGKGKLSHYGNGIYALHIEDGKTPYGPDGSLVKSTKEGIDNSIPSFIVKFNAPEHERAVNQWKHYWTWIENRNEVRSKLEEYFGYDTKHGMHIVRLLRMALEIIETGKVNIKRDDAEELKSIRFDGIWSLDDIKEYAEIMRQKIEKAIETSPLREMANKEQMVNLCLTAEKIHRKTSEIKNESDNENQLNT